MYNPKTVDVFERHMRKLGCYLLPKVTHTHGEILLAERKILERAEVVYETNWMISRNGIDFGRGVRNYWSVPQETRIAEALEDAYGWIEANIKVKRYG